MIALIAKGHVLIEGIPGIGKTLLARTIARCFDCRFRRIQFTNDLMPTDVIGTTVWSREREEFQFVQGPLFANMVLADEINRTSPRTLSCLLEAMESGFVSIEGKPVQLADPFLVLATRNPIEFHGTFPVPEAALDRFTMRVELSYPEADSEIELYLNGPREQQMEAVEPWMERETLVSSMARVNGVTVEEPVARYVLGVVNATRSHADVRLGASPRAALLWVHTARARALLHGRAYVLPDDLKTLAVPVLGHRIFKSSGAAIGDALRDIVDSVPVTV